MRQLFDSCRDRVPCDEGEKEPAKRGDSNVAALQMRGGVEGGGRSDDVRPLFRMGGGLHGGETTMYNVRRWCTYATRPGPSGAPLRARTLVRIAY